MTIITWFSIKLSMNGRKKNETTWAAKGLICFKPKRLSHRPSCQWWSVWPLTSGTRRSCGPRVSGSALRENIKGVHTIWASDWQSINHSSPATVQLQCAGFFSPPPVSLFLSHAQKHTHRTQSGTQKQMYGISFDSDGEFGLLSAFCPLLCPTSDLHLFYQAHAYMLFFFAGQGQAGRVLLSSTYFMGSDEAGWHSRTPAWPGAGVGLGVHKVWKQSNLVQTRKWTRCFCHLLGRPWSRKLYCCTVPTVLDCRKPLVTSVTNVKAGLVDGTCFTLNWILF